ncbi:MAG: hypothetical protein ABI411_18690 [Tahibacter sp.]
MGKDIRAIAGTEYYANWPEAVRATSPGGDLVLIANHHEPGWVWSEDGLVRIETALAEADLHEIKVSLAVCNSKKYEGRHAGVSGKIYAADVADFVRQLTSCVAETLQEKESTLAEARRSAVTARSTGDLTPYAANPVLHARAKGPAQAIAIEEMIRIQKEQPPLLAQVMKANIEQRKKELAGNRAALRRAWFSEHAKRSLPGETMSQAEKDAAADSFAAELEADPKFHRTRLTLMASTHEVEEVKLMQMLAANAAADAAAAKRNGVPYSEYHPSAEVLKARSLAEAKLIAEGTSVAGFGRPIGANLAKVDMTIQRGLLAKLAGKGLVRQVLPAASLVTTLLTIYELSTSSNENTIPAAKNTGRN